MKVLLTGASGFIGRKLGQELVRRGHEVVVLLRQPTLLPFPCEQRLWDNSDSLPSPLDAVIHLAGESIGEGRWTQERKEQIVASRVETLSRLQARLRSSGIQPRIFVGASAIGFYGDRGDEWLDEQSSPGQGFLAETCIAWEEATKKWALAERSVIIRLGVVLDRGGGALAKMLPIFKKGVGGPLAGGKQFMSWIHREDAVNLLATAMENAQWQGVINGVSPQPQTNGSFTRILAESLGVWAPFPAPAFALKLVMGEMADLVLQSQRVKSRALDLGFQFRYPTLVEAFNQILGGVEKRRGALCHEIEFEQWLSAPVGEVFKAFSEPKVIEELSPPEAEVRVLSSGDSRLGTGAKVRFEAKCRGMKMECETEVLDWKENVGFASTLTRGPCDFWLHEHRFERLGSGTLLRDRVVYRMKVGLLGDLLGLSAFEKEMKAVFAYRAQALAKRFPTVRD
jgi:uncharacterized protein